MKPDFAQLATWSGGAWHLRPAAACTGFCIDSRKLRPGDLFIALAGKAGRDGHEFLAAAAKAGACAAMVTRVDPSLDLPQLQVHDCREALQRIARAWRDLFAGPVVAITGSCGKTSTKELLALLLSAAGPVCATPGNLNNELGVPLSLLNLDPQLHRFAVIEAGINQPGEMVRLGQTIHADRVILTMIGAAHLELLGSLDGIAAEKTALIRTAKSGVHYYCPADCLQYAALHNLPGSGTFTLYQGEQQSSCNYRQNQGGRWLHVTQKRAPASVSLSAAPPSSIELSLHCTHRGCSNFTLPTMSEGMLSNAALAIAVALDLGISPAMIQSQLAKWLPAEQRGQLKTIHGRAFYVDCYNANPSSLHDAARYFVHLFPQPPRTFVIGGMRELGAQSQEWHFNSGKNLPVQAGDRVIAIGAEAQPLLDGVRQAQSPSTIDCFYCSETTAATALLNSGCEPVFIKGSRAYALESLVPCSAN